MKATGYIFIVLLAGGIVAWLIFDAKKAKTFTPTANFDTDDQRLYNMIRADLQAYEMKLNKDPLAWFDEMVTGNYDTSFIGTRKSKTAAYVRTLATLNPNHPKNHWYGQLLANLENRYK